ncbi:MAG: TonB-dependent receptor [Novosphingobium sp.]|uniref:TonB-dependent siderophore receptor n=1 Tax=Novosphingobium sp. TaxID=1874826 RepID=UPI0032B86C3F
MRRTAPAVWLAPGLALGALALGSAAARAQDRSGDNAVTQADDAFGFSVGREGLGIYNQADARGFSPTDAGNVRIDGLYFDPAFDLSELLVDSTAIKVGLSAQGYPFAAPSGIVDMALRRPGKKSGASLVVDGDLLSSAGAELTGTVRLSGSLALGYGAKVAHTAFPDGTNNFNHGQALALYWQPAEGIELIPFWALYNDYDDESGPFYIPAGSTLPPLAPRRQYDGPDWADFRLMAGTQGLLGSAQLGRGWTVRLGAFRSVFEQRTGFTNLLVDVQPDGSANRVVIADPPLRNVALSGELRLSRTVAEGPRQHVVHLSLRERDARRQFDGSVELVLGPTRIGTPEDGLPPAVWNFGPVSKQRIRQDSLGLAYNGRWKKVGELGLGLSRVRYRMTTDLPGEPRAEGRSDLWLYNANLAATVTPSLSLYVGYARGLEESGLAPPNAANRNAPLPAIITNQKDGGFRLALGKKLKLIGGVFELTRPNFGFDGANLFRPIGTIRNRGAEFSLSGPLTPRLDVVAGGMLLDARVHGAGGGAAVGRRPVGLPSHFINLNLNWRTPWLAGLALDSNVSFRGRTMATTDNAVAVPARTVVNLGARYSFKVAGRDVTARAQMINLFDSYGFRIAGPGIYRTNGSRQASFYLAVDF